MSLGALTVKIGADLTDLNKGLTEAGRGVTNFSKQVSGSSSNIQGLTRSSTSAASGITRLREPLTSVTRQLLQLNPAVSQVSSVLGSLAIGALPMVAVLAGVAALSFGWNRLTKDARENAKATEEAIKSLTALRDEQRLGSLKGTKAREAELAGIKLSFVQDDIAVQEQRIRDARRGGYKDPRAETKLATLLLEQKKLRDAIDAYENEVTVIRGGAADKQVADQQAALEKEKAAWKSFFASLAEMRRNQRDLDDMNTMPSISDFKPGSMRVNGVAAPSQIPPSVFATVNAVNILAARKIHEAAAELKASAQMQQEATLQDMAVSGAMSLLSRHGGAVGGILSSIIGGAVTAGPMGAVLGGGIAIADSLLSNRKSVDKNTSAVERLTASMMNEPAGFKVEAFRFRSSQGAPHMNFAGAIITVLASDPAEFVRKMGRYGDDAAARGGLVAAYG